MVSILIEDCVNLRSLKASFFIDKTAETFRVNKTIYILKLHTMETIEKHEEIAQQIKSTYGISIPEDTIKKAYVVAEYISEIKAVVHNLPARDLVRAAREANEHDIWWYYKIQGLHFENWTLATVLCQTIRTDALVTILRLEIENGLDLSDNKFLIDAISELTKYIPGAAQLNDFHRRIIDKAVNTNDHNLLTVLEKTITGEVEAKQNLEKNIVASQIARGHISIDFKQEDIRALIRRIPTPYELKHQNQNMVLIGYINKLIEELEIEELEVIALQKINDKEGELLTILATMMLMKKIEVENRLNQK
jgi:hypothetical protein